MNASNWKLYPGMAGLFLAPFLYGCVNVPAQIVVGMLLAVSVLLLASATPVASAGPRWLQRFIILLLLFQLVPLPAALVSWLSPNQVDLANAFPPVSQKSASWLPLTTSPAASVQRLWELALVSAAFLIGAAAARRETQHLFLRTLAFALVGLAAAEIWYLLDRRGPLDIAWPVAAGTFANRNHFANWLCVASLLLLGWVLRLQAPLNSARVSSSGPKELRPLEAILTASAVLAGLLAAAASGSRGGAIAFMGGGAAWMLLLYRRSHSQKRWLQIVLGAVILLVVISSASSGLLRRAASEGSHAHTKTGLWIQTLRLAADFPLTGTGLGTFATTFNHFKTSHGQQTFWHAENDWLQWLVETGVITTAAAFAWICIALRNILRTAWRWKMAEPELIFGAVAALAAFALHALAEFVFQVTANSLLIAAILGFASAHARPAPGSAAAVPSFRRSRFALGLFLITAGLIQALAASHASRAKVSDPSGAVLHLKTALRLWPFDSMRLIPYLRAEAARVHSLPHAEQIREIASARDLARRRVPLDPYNWELRLERACFELAFGTEPQEAVAEGLRTVRLNPLQPEIPWRFAEQLVRVDPTAARPFIRAIDVSTPLYLQRALSLTWQVSQNPAELWPVTPNDPAALQILGDFALQQRLFPMATQAFLKLTNSLPPAILAERLIRCGRPDLAKPLLRPPFASLSERLLFIRVLALEGDHLRVLHETESLALSSSSRHELLSQTSSPDPLDTLKNALSESPGDNTLVRSIAEKIYLLPPLQRDLTLLKNFAAQFPEELRLTWLLLQSQADAHRYAEASVTALELAHRIVALHESPRRP